MKITLYRGRVLSPCKRIWDIWSKMGRQKLQFLNLWKHIVPHLLSFSSLTELNHHVCFCPIESIQKQFPAYQSFFFFSPFSAWSQLGYCWQFLCWQASQGRLWVADSCWNKSLALWGEKEIHSTFLVSLFPCTLTSFFLLYSYHNNSLVHWMQTVGIFFHI